MRAHRVDEGSFVTDVPAAALSSKAALPSRDVSVALNESSREINLCEETR